MVFSSLPLFNLSLFPIVWNIPNNKCIRKATTLKIQCAQKREIIIGNFYGSRSPVFSYTLNNQYFFGDFVISKSKRQRAGKSPCFFPVREWRMLGQRDFS